MCLLSRSGHQFLAPLFMTQSQYAVATAPAAQYVEGYHRDAKTTRPWTDDASRQPAKRFLIWEVVPADSGARLHPGWDTPPIVSD
jgi:hypothetical protein